MKVTAERIPESKVLLRIEIPPEQVTAAIDRTYRDLARRVRIPGFRPGKAPRPLIDRYVGGAESVQQEGIDRLIDESYRKALAETDTHPIGDPDIPERPEFKKGEPLVIEASVPVAPRVELGEYESIRMPPITVEATPEQVNSLLEALREQNAEWTTVNRPLQNGDRATIDVVGIAGAVPTLYGPGGETILQTIGGKEVFNEKGHEHSIDVEGPVEFAPGFDEELIGLTAGSEKRFGLTLPADFRDSELAHQSVIFTVTVHDAKEKHLPEIDEEFAKKVGGGDTVDQLRESTRAMIQRRLEQEVQQSYENSLLSVVLERSTIELPEVMVQRQIDSEVEELKANAARQKLEWSSYLEAIGRTEESLRADLREPARHSLQSYLVLQEIARREGVGVAPEEINAEIESTAAQFGRAAAIVRERLNTRDQRENIESRILHRKAMGRLREIAQQPSSPGSPREVESIPEPAATDDSAAEPAEAAAAVAEVPLGPSPESVREVALESATPTSEEPPPEVSASHG